jgi:glycosyltransferase involved in cell wall biosynthesis
MKHIGNPFVRGLKAVFIEHRLPWRLQHMWDQLFPASVEPYAVVSFDPLIIMVPHPIHRQQEYKTKWKAFLKVLKEKRVYFLCRMQHSIELDRSIKAVEVGYLGHKKDYPAHEFIYLANSLKELELLDKIHIPAIFCNQNAFIDENIFRVIPGTEKRYDAVYNARFIEVKRHYLAAQLKKLALITYFTAESREERDLDGFKKILPEAVMLNWNGCPSLKQISGLSGNERIPYDKIAQYLNQAKVGLILSEKEGACYATAEYLLCGLPVVSTKSLGGRDVFFDDEYTRIVDNTPDAVREGVEELIRRNIPPEYVREKTLEKMRPHRERFIKLIQEIYDKENVHRNFADEFKEKIILNKAFIHSKTLKYLDKRSVKRDLKIS